MHNLSLDRWQGRKGIRGLGTVQSTATAESIAASGSSATVATLVAMGTIAGPVGLAITAVIGAAISIASLFKGCGATCTEATQIANQAGSIIDTAFSAYMSAPVHYASMQSAYLQLFTTTMQAMDQACSDPSLGTAGQNCISQRANNGECTFQTPSGEWQQDTTGAWSFNPNAGPNCWNSWIGRYNPVANDPTVVPDPTGAVTDASGNVTSIVSSPIASLTSIFSSGNGLLLVGAALLLFAFMEKD